MSNVNKPDVVILNTTVLTREHLKSNRKTVNNRTSTPVPPKKDKNIRTYTVKRKNQGKTVAQVNGKTRNFTVKSNIDLQIEKSIPEQKALDLHSNQETVTNFYYVKIHKTGSTTLQNILYRFGFKRDLLFALFNCENAMPFPNPAYKKYLIPSQYRAFNIVVDHSVFEPKAFNEYMLPKRKVIAQIREPFANLISSFSFHRLQKAFRIYKDDPISIFLKQPQHYDQNARWVGSSRGCQPLKRPSYTKNPMIFHLGYVDQKISDPEYIKSFLQDLEKKVDHILILEKYEESLVVMKRLFNWETKDILSMPIWSRKFHGSKDLHKRRSAEDDYKLQQLHKAWSPADYALYEFYKTKLDYTLQEQKEEFWDEVRELKALAKETRGFCQTMCVKADSVKLFNANYQTANQFLSHHNFSVGKTKFHKAFNVTYKDCVSMVLATLEYHAASKAKQVPRLCDNRIGITTRARPKLDSRFCNKNDRTVFTFPWNFIRLKLFKSKYFCMKHING